MAGAYRNVARRTLKVAAWAFAVILASLFLATPALAKDYSIDAVNIAAAVNSDGTLSVTEMRDFNFDGSFHGVYWKIPKGYNSSNGKEVDITINYVGVYENGQIQPFGLSNAETDGTYEVYDYGSYERVKLYSAHEDESARFVISYSASGIVTRWDDTGELYWKFVSDGWDVESQNVTCTVSLPVPSGESVTPEENVRAWGHGPLDASVAFDGNDIVYSVPGVGTDEYAEARITFPTSWISDCEVTSGSELSSILSEEQQWADEANAKREQAWIVEVVSIVVAVAAVVLSIVSIILIKRNYRRNHTPVFNDKYFRDVPTADHPAVLGALHRGGSADVEDFTATLMRLTDQGVVKLEKVKIKKDGLFRDKVEEDYRLTLTGVPDNDSNTPEGEAAARIDEAALHMLFDKIAPATSESSGTRTNGSHLYFSRIEEYARDNPEEYSDAYSSWSNTIEGQYISRFSGSSKGTGRGKLGAIFAFDCFVLPILACFFFIVIGLPWYVILGTVAALEACGIVAIVSMKELRPLTQEGVEVAAKLDALERWLREFTRLEEAVPRDVVLWNRLLVMAVVLGVANEVIDQLKMVAPEILDDVRMRPTYGWYYYGIHGGLGSPASVFAGAAQAAHSVSTAALASSTVSSGGGGGGGFSGGGGGGFGGGGGGGAF